MEEFGTGAREKISGFFSGRMAGIDSDGEARQSLSETGLRIIVRQLYCCTENINILTTSNYRLTDRRQRYLLFYSV